MSTSGTRRWARTRTTTASRAAAGESAIFPSPPPTPQLRRHELHRHHLHRRHRHHLHLHPRSLGWLLYLSDDGWDEPGGSGSGGQLRAYPRRDVHGCVGSHDGNLQVSSSSAPLA